MGPCGQLSFLSQTEQHHYIRRVAANSEFQSVGRSVFSASELAVH